MSAAPATDPSAIELAGGALSVSPLGVGTWAWGDRTWGWKGYDSSYGLGTIREAYVASVEAGVTFLDTAEGYGSGESERIIGGLLEEDRELAARVTVATKFLPLPQRFFVGREMRQALEASLERLRLDRVDLYQVHGPISLRSHAAMADALAAVVEDGLVTTVGVSNYSVKETRAIHARLAERGIPLATNQVELSLLRTRPERTGLLAACAELGVRVLAYSPIGQGRLTGKYSASNPPPGRRSFSDFPMSEVDPVVATLREIGAEHGGRAPAQIALAWLMAKGAIPIPGAKSREQAEQNAGALGVRLSSEQVERLDRRAKLGRNDLRSRLWQHG